MDHSDLRQSGDISIQVATLMACEIGSWGAYVPLALFSLYALLARGIRSSKPRQMMTAAILIMFACSSAATMINLREHWIPFVWTLVEGTQNGYRNEFPDGRRSYRESERGFSMSTEWSVLQRVNLALSDVIVMWRCWTLWRYHCRATLFLCVGLILLLIAFVSNIMTTIVFALWASGTQSPNLAAGSFIYILLVVPFPFVNVAATVLMGYKTWEYRKDMQTLTVAGTSLRKFERMMLFLTESGMFYSMYWIVISISAFTPLPRAFATYLILNTMFVNISGIYPTLVIVLVLFDKTVECDIVRLSDSRRAIASSSSFTMRFTPSEQHSISIPRQSHLNRGTGTFFPVPSEQESPSVIGIAMRKRDDES